MTVASTIRTESDILARLDDVARQMGRSRNWAINKAMEDFVEHHEWYLAKVREGVEAADAGRFASREELEAVFLEFGA